MAPCTHPADRSLVLFTARDYVSGEEFRVASCAACGLARTVPQPDESRTPAYYPDGYYGSPAARRFPAVIEAFQRLLYARRARAVELLSGRPGRVLDVGCGRGLLLDAFRRRGWEAHGAELDDRSAAYARDVLGLPVHVGPAEAFPWPANHFDALVMWHVLEHLADPSAAIERAARLVRPGGVVMIGVPNFASPEARLARDRWFHLDVPRHLVHLDGAWLDRALGDAGLAVRRRSFLAPEFDVFSFVQSVENRIGLRHNLLYDVLRGATAKVLAQGDASRLQATAAAVLAVPLTLLGAPFALLLGLAARGSSVTVWAVKRT